MQYETVKNDPQASKNLFELIKTDNFVKLKEKDVQISLLNSVKNRPKDDAFREVITSLAGKDDFKAFGKTEQLKVIEDLDKFTKTTGYQGDATNPTSRDDKIFLLEKIRKTSIFSGKDRSNKIVRNTLDQIVNGTINLKLYEKDSTKNSNGSSSTEFGYNKAGTKDIYINKKANDTDYKEFIDTLTHETNHALNGGTKMKYVSELFLNEYRAFVVGQNGAGKKVNKEFLKSVVYNLALAEPNLDSKTKKPLDGYSFIRQEYKTNTNFKKFIDELVKDIDKGTIIEGADLRTRMMKAGYNTDYIKNTNNADNS